MGAKQFGKMMSSKNSLSWLICRYQSSFSELKIRIFVHTCNCEIILSLRINEWVICVFADIRFHKVLIEDYNAETQKFQIRHVQEQASKSALFSLYNSLVSPHFSLIIIKKSSKSSFLSLYKNKTVSPHFSLSFSL